MKGNIHHIEIENEYLRIYFDSADIPDTYFINQYMLTILKVGYADNLIEFMKVHRSENDITRVVFETRGDCMELVGMIHNGDITYTLKQARLIIRWINKNIHYEGDAEDWASIYAEILENANDA